MGNTPDRIEMVVPFKAEYVSVVRLTVSGIASRIGFDMDSIEDIKVALAEICSKFVSIGSEITENYKIVFNVYVDKLEIMFECFDKGLKCAFDMENDGLAIALIMALVDDVQFCPDDKYILSMTKVFERN